jgi:hypothetical protein
MTNDDLTRIENMVTRGHDLTNEDAKLLLERFRGNAARHVRHIAKLRRDPYANLEED